MGTRARIFWSLGVMVVIFTSVQFWFAYRQMSMHPVDYVRYKSRAYTTVKNFLTLGSETRVKLILVDPYILNEIVSESFHDGGRPCRVLCKNHIYTFALLSSDYEKFKLELLPKMKDQGFDIQVAYEFGDVGDVGETPCHIYLRDHDHHAIHVVVLHDQGSHWWFGSDVNNEYQLDFTQQSGLLDKFGFDEAPMDGLEIYMPHYPKKFLSEYKESRFIPCNKTRTDNFYKLYPRNDTRKAIDFTEKAVNVVKAMKRRLDDFGVPFWLSSGTLLGWFRQCDVIPYSQDVDLGIFIKDHPKGFLAKLKRTGMHLEHKFGKIEDSLQYAFDMGDIKLDLFFFYEDKEAGQYWNGGTDYNSGAKYRYNFNKFTLCWTEFYGLKVRVPCETEDYIKANYGPNWFHPVKKWDWKSSPSNVIEVASWRDDELDDVIQLFDKKGRRISLEWVDDDEPKKKVEL